jgi:transposase
MGKQVRYSAEMRERAVRLFQQHVHDHPSRWAAMESIASKMGCTPQTLSTWVARAEASSDPRKNAALADRERMKQLKRENAELRRANEILRTASAYFAQAELDRRRK